MNQTRTNTLLAKVLAKMMKGKGADLMTNRVLMEPKRELASVDADLVKEVALKTKMALTVAEHE